jgi:hypothetical protein
MRAHTFSYWAAALVLAAFLSLAAAQDVRAMYLFKDVLKSNTAAITTSGFNAAIMFGVGILENGDIMYYSNTPGSVDTLIASGGQYVGGTALQDKVRSLKASGSNINRLEICTNSNNIQALMSNPGPGSNTNLYRNLAALKTAWNLDAVNNNDEAIYHLDSTLTFGRMVGTIGYKYTLVPYTRVSFWQSVKSQLGSLVDRVYLQCYDGGASNDPISWENQLGMGVVPLIWVTNDAKPQFGQTPAQARSRFTAWQARGTLAGGGYWNEYDIEKMGLSYEEYADVLNDLFS